MPNSARDWLMAARFTRVAAIQFYRDRLVFVDDSLIKDEEEKDPSQFMPDHYHVRSIYQIKHFGELWYRLDSNSGKLTVLAKSIKANVYDNLTFLNCPIRILTSNCTSFDHQAAQVGEYPWR